MSLFAIILLAIALSIDACVVSFAHGLVLEGQKFRNAMKLAVFTGFSQGLMPFIGFSITESFIKYVEPVGKWLTFAIFMYLGMKIIQESFEKDKEIPISLTLKSLFFIAIATSIDALAAGITLSLTSTNILTATVLIGSTTFILSFFGYYSGCCLKKLSTKALEILAGTILIFLAIKSLF